MNKRFFLILALMTLLFGGWGFVAHELGRQQHATLEDLAELPVYCYVSDTSNLDSILEGIQRLEKELTYTHETGFQAGMDLVESYGLPHTDSTIAGYDLPDVITITFPASPAAIATKAKLMNHLGTFQQDGNIDVEIDSQSSAYAKLMLRYLNQKKDFIHFTVFISILLLLIFVFGRQVLELRNYIHEQSRRLSVVDVMRYRKQSNNRSFTMFVVPVGVVAAVYYLGVYFNFWDNFAIWWSFVVMALVCIVGTIISHLIMRSFVMDMQLSMEDSVVVVERFDEEDDA